MVARIFRFSVPHIWLAQNHTEWRWIDIPIGQGPSIVPMWLTGLKKLTWYGLLSMQQDPVSYQFQSTCVFSVHTHKMCVFLFFSALISSLHIVCDQCYLYAAFFTNIVHWKTDPLKGAEHHTVCLKLFETTLFSPKSSFAQPSQIVYLLDRVKTA